MSLVRQKINQKSYNNLPNSVFWGWLSVEIQSQNPEFWNNPENFHLRALRLYPDILDPLAHQWNDTIFSLYRPKENINSSFLHRTNQTNNAHTFLLFQTPNYI